MYIVWCNGINVHCVFIYNTKKVVLVESCTNEEKVNSPKNETNSILYIFDSG